MRESPRRERTCSSELVRAALSVLCRLPVSSQPLFRAVCPPLLISCKGDKNAAAPPHSGSYTSCRSVSSDSGLLVGGSCNREATQPRSLSLYLKPCSSVSTIWIVLCSPSTDWQYFTIQRNGRFELLHTLHEFSARHSVCALNAFEKYEISIFFFSFFLLLNILLEK